MALDMLLWRRYCRQSAWLSYKFSNILSSFYQAVPLLSADLNLSQNPYPDVLVDSIRLQALLQRVEAIDDPTTPEDMHRLNLSILREAINMTFTKIELANASGLGLRRTRTDSGYPLDRRKVEAIKGKCYFQHCFCKKRFCVYLCHWLFHAQVINNFLVEKQSGTVEVCWAHNPEVRRS